jgi:hypothetical protein
MIENKTVGILPTSLFGGRSALVSGGADSVQAANPVESGGIGALSQSASDAF